MHSLDLKSVLVGAVVALLVVKFVLPRVAPSLAAKVG